MGSMGMDEEELLRQFFSFNMGGGPGMGPMGGRGGKRRGEDSIIPYDVTLEDLYMGKTAHFNLEKNIICGHCSGCVSVPLCSSSTRDTADHVSQILVWFTRSGGKSKAKPIKCLKCDGHGMTAVPRAVRTIECDLFVS